jgi:hypothetical protein
MKIAGSKKTAVIILFSTFAPQLVSPPQADELNGKSGESPALSP